MMTMISLTAGTAFIMWLGSRSPKRIGSRISLIIFARIGADAYGNQQQHPPPPDGEMESWRSSS
jgi:preprotein translocase subunit SecY